MKEKPFPAGTGGPEKEHFNCPGDSEVETIAKGKYHVGKKKKGDGDTSGGKKKGRTEKKAIPTPPGVHPTEKKKAPHARNAKKRGTDVSSRGRTVGRGKTK